MTLKVKVTLRFGFTQQLNKTVDSAHCFGCCVCMLYFSSYQMLSNLLALSLK